MPQRILVLLTASLMVGCYTSDGAPDGGVEGDGGPVVRSCYAYSLGRDLIPGEACEFAEPCRTFWDYYMGYCGDETWSCVEGHVVYTDNRFRCSLPDAGVDAPTAAWCADYTPPPAATGTDCRTSDDCASAGGTCWVPGDTTGLHAGGACPMECETDGECADGSVCVAINGGSCHRCDVACTEESCGPWEACGDDGHCVPADCATDGYVCPPGSACGGASADAHGCTTAPCATDADCGCGACVDGACAAGPGRCDLPRP